MKKNKCKNILFILILVIVILIGNTVCAHSGRTDSNGGHKDNKNKSGLGSYHYHCGGYPAHLHENGVCPYSASTASYSSSNEQSSQSSTSTSMLETKKEEVVSTSANAENKQVEETLAPSTQATEKTVKETSVKLTTDKEEVVEEKTVSVENIKINENLTTMKVGENTKLTVTITPENATDKNVEWESSNEDIATISETGKIVALDVGKVKITAKTSDGKADVIEITVEELEEEIIAPIQNNEISNTTTVTAEDADNVSGILGLGLIGGGYWAYKKIKKSKK